MVIYLLSRSVSPLEKRPVQFFRGLSKLGYSQLQLTTLALPARLAALRVTARVILKTADGRGRVETLENVGRSSSRWRMT
jgi:hypothetical protein